MTQPPDPSTEIRTMAPLVTAVGVGLVGWSIVTAWPVAVAGGLTLLLGLGLWLRSARQDTSQDEHAHE